MIDLIVSDGLTGAAAAARVGVSRATANNWLRSEKISLSRGPYGGIFAQCNQLRARAVAMVADGRSRVAVAAELGSCASRSAYGAKMGR